MRREDRILGNKVATAIMFFVLSISMLAVTRTIEVVQASGPIYIRADGSVDPATAPIQRHGDLYMLTENINFDTHGAGIVIEKNNTVFDGQGYSLTGTGLGKGIVLSGRNNVTIRHLEIYHFSIGIYLENFAPTM